MTRLVLSRHVPRAAQERIRRAVPGIDIIDDPRAQLPASGRVGLLYREEDRTVPLEVPDCELIERWTGLLEGAEVLFDLHPAALDLIADHAPRLSFIQAIAAGASELLAHEGIRSSGVTITTARGVHDDGLADFVMASLLSHVKRFDELRVQQQQGLWHELEARSLDTVTMTVAGYGSIGRAIATRARAFGIRVTGVRSHPEPDALADRVYGASQLDEALREADVVVNALPLTPDTANLFGRERFAAFKPGAFFINVGRGGTVEEPALMEALHSRRIAGAAVDVAAQEPLAADDPLWSAPNLLISPHCASLMPGVAFDKMIDILITNLQLFEARKPLINVASESGHVPPGTSGIRKPVIDTETTTSRRRR